MSFLSVGGTTLHHRYTAATTTAQPMILINSLGTDFRIWDEVIARLAGEMPLLAYDKRGHGLSDIGGGVRSIDDHVDDLSALIDHFAFEKVVLCGLSVGGMIAQGFYARRPDIVEALILCDTAHKIGTTESWNTRIATVERDGIEAIADAVLKVWFTPEFHHCPRCRSCRKPQHADQAAPTWLYRNLRGSPRRRLHGKFPAHGGAGALHRR